MSAVVANRQLLRTENKLSLSMGRLSSGYKINKAGDNPAGMAISSKMKAQIDGLNQAEANSDDGQSVLRIADGALNEVSNMLQRIRELSVQAANGTNSYSDRQSIQDEIDQLTQEVDRISTDTEYNKKTLLDGSANTRVYVSGTHKDTTKFARSATRIDFSEEVLPGDYTITVDEVAKEATYTLDMSNLINDPNFDGGTVSINGVGIEYEKGMSADDVYKQLMSVADEIGCKFEKDPNKAGVYNITADNKGSKETLTIGMSKEMAQKTGLSKAQGVVQNADDESYKLIASGSDAKVTLGNEFGSTVITNVEGNRVKITDKGGFSMDFLLSDDVQNGDKSDRTPWYEGPSLLDFLETVPIDKDRNYENFRFPVQYVLRPNLDFRGFSGKVASGVIRKGDEVMALPSRKKSRVKSIVTYEGEIEEAFPPMCVTLTLEDEIDVSRGEMLVHPNDLPVEKRGFEAMLVWMDEEPMDTNKQFYLKQTTNTTRARIDTIRYKVNVNTMEQSAVDHLELNEIGKVVISTNKELFFDSYAANKQTGSFILIDPITNNTSAVGMILNPVDDNQLVLENESNVITLNLPEMGINPEHYEAVEKVCKEIESRGIELRIIK